MHEIRYIQAINEALREELRRDPLTFVMGLDVWVGAFNATKGLIDEFGPERIRNTPISEAGYAGAAACVNMPLAVNFFSKLTSGQRCFQASISSAGRYASLPRNASSPTTCPSHR